MSKKAPWMAWYPADILTDAAYLAMTWEQRGMYRHLLDVSWINVHDPYVVAVWQAYRDQERKVVER